MNQNVEYGLHVNPGMEPPVDRRRFVQLVSGGVAVGLAGCVGDDGENGDDDSPTDDGSSDDGTESTSSEGLVYAFAPNTIAIIDPEAGEIVDEITEGIDGNGWGDPRVTSDHEQLFVIEDTLGQVLVIDTESREVVSEIDIGPDPTHMYHPTDDEMWAHSDEEGAFYVIDTTSHDVVDVVESGLEAEGHGKLLYHPDFGSKAYATNVNDPAALIIDVAEYERTGYVELGNDGGTHYKAYSPQNGLAYFEYGDTTAVVDVETDEIVDELDFSGGMYLTPDEELLGVLDGDVVRFLDVTDEESEEIGSVDVGDGPDALRYYDADGTRYGFTANTMNDQAAVIDIDDLEVVETLEIGDIERPDDAPFLHRTGVAGDGYFITPAEADGTVAVIDMDALELLEQVDVEEGVDTVQYVGDSGVGYTGAIR